MKYIFMIMLFVTAPNAIKDRDKGTPKDKRIWALQSATTMEVSSLEWCKALALSIDGSVSSTATVTTRMFCIPKDEQDFIAEQPKVPSTSGEKPGTLHEFTKSQKFDEQRLQCAIANAIQIGRGQAKSCN